MRYDTEELRKLARRILPRAQKNLRKHGYLEPVGLVVRPDGFIDTVTFQWRTLGEKRKAQRDFQMELLKRNAVAAVIVSETWVKFADDGPLDLGDLTRSVRDMPGRKDAIMGRPGLLSAGWLLSRPLPSSGPARSPSMTPGNSRPLPVS